MASRRSPAPSCSAYRPGPGCGHVMLATPSRETGREAARPARNPRFFPRLPTAALLSEGIAPVDSPWETLPGSRCTAPLAEGVRADRRGPLGSPAMCWMTGWLGPAVSGGVAHPVAHRAFRLIGDRRRGRSVDNSVWAFHMADSGGIPGLSTTWCSTWPPVGASLRAPAPAPDRSARSVPASLQEPRPPPDPGSYEAARPGN